MKFLFVELIASACYLGDSSFWRLRHCTKAHALSREGAKQTLDPRASKSNTGKALRSN